jgi:4'-phosphopantetheinyl transferase
MKTSTSLHHNTVHLWRVWLNDFNIKVQNLTDLLSQDEKARATRLHFDIHRERFIIARAFLRKILHLYTGISPELIQFIYGRHGKPSINYPLQFNVSHSD